MTDQEKLRLMALFIERVCPNHIRIADDKGNTAWDHGGHVWYDAYSFDDNFDKALERLLVKHDEMWPTHPIYREQKEQEIKLENQRLKIEIEKLKLELLEKAPATV